MPEQYNFQSQEVRQVEVSVSTVDFAEVPAFVASPFQKLSSAELATSAPCCVRLDLENLECFEVVERQFQQQGVTFANAIALHPSNPAFPPYSGLKVLMGSPRSGWLEAKFQCPVQFVSGFITSSRRAVLSAFDSEGNLLAQSEIPVANLAGSNSTILPNAQLHLRIPNIHRVTFYAFDGHLTLDDFSFSF